MNILVKFLSCYLILLLVSGCGKSDNNRDQETIVKGNLDLLVDESLLPIIQSQVEIFELHYNAKITIEAKSEAEIIQTMANDSSRVAILARRLNEQETKVFLSKKINPKITKFATDAIVLIANQKFNDSVIDLHKVLSILQSKKVDGISGLVFDNPNSSSARYLSELAGVAELPQEHVFSFKTNEETIKYVAENDGMIGVVGLNWIVEPNAASQSYVEKVKVLSVKGKSENVYIFPSQNDIAEGKYPLARDLFIVNCQGYSGLGMGLASFIAGETGQRIILKSGLVPAKTPSRKILIRNGIEKPK